MKNQFIPCSRLGKYLFTFVEILIISYMANAQPQNLLKIQTPGNSLPTNVITSALATEKYSTTYSLWDLGLGTSSPNARLHIQSPSLSLQPVLTVTALYNGLEGASIRHLAIINSQNYGIYETSNENGLLNYFRDPLVIGNTFFGTDIINNHYYLIKSDSTINSIIFNMNKTFYPLIITQNGIHVRDSLITNLFKLSTNAGQGNILVSDALGNGSWKNPLDFYDLTWKRTANDDLWSNCTNNVGIGTKTPKDKFQVNDGSIKVAIGRADARDLNYGNGYLGFNAARQVIDSQPQWTFNSDGLHNGGSVIWSNMTGTIYFAPVDAVDPLNMNQSLSDQRLFSNVKMAIYSNGKVAIGTDQIPGDHTLYVKGGILTEEIVVKLLGDWSDYVFSSSYKKLPLPELENYINTNHHLPDIPTENEIKSQGLDVGKMNSLLVKKVEELSLYVIELQKQIDELKKSKEE